MGSTAETQSGGAGRSWAGEASPISAHRGRAICPLHQSAVQPSPALPPRTPVETLRTAGVCGAVLTALLPAEICSLEPACPRP